MFIQLIYQNPICQAMLDRCSQEFSELWKMTCDRMIELVIFDLDGTLIDSLADIADAANKSLRSHLLPIHPTDSYRYFVGNGLQNLIRRIVPPQTTDLVRQEISEGFKINYSRNWNNQTLPYPGILKMLNSLDEKGIGTAILSNKPHSFTTSCVEEFFFGNAFLSVYGQQPTIPLKPDPGGALRIIEKLNCPARKCLFVGDTSIDIQTGNAAGMTSMGVTWGFRDRSELVEAGADIIINNPEEIVRHVCRSI